MLSERTLTLIIRLLEECLEYDYAAEELRSKIREILRLLDVDHAQLTILIIVNGELSIVNGESPWTIFRFPV